MTPSLLRIGMAYLVTLIVTYLICVVWKLVLAEWPEPLPAVILTLGVGVVVGRNWPWRWL